MKKFDDGATQFANIQRSHDFPDLYNSNSICTISLSAL